MTDKKKIRKEVERLMTELIQEKKKGYSSDVDDACILELQNVLTYIDSLSKEPVSEDLKQAIHNAIFALDERKGYTFKLEDMFIAGAEWQKEQMMKEAVETTVSSMVHQLIVTDYIIINAEQFGLKKGDKVKVLIIKEE